MEIVSWYKHFGPTVVRIPHSGTYYIRDYGITLKQPISGLFFWGYFKCYKLYVTKL